MRIQGLHVAVAALSSVLLLASCQATVGVAGVGNGAAVGLSTTVGSPVNGTYLTRNLLTVVPDPSSPGRFEVRQKAGEGGSGYWCAAGQYVIEGRRMDPSTRIYLEQPLGRGKVVGGNSIGFTIAPNASLSATAAAQTNGLSLSMNRIGENWTAAHANSQCRPLPGFFFF